MGYRRRSSTFQFEHDHFRRNAVGVIKNQLEVFFLVS